MTKTLALAAVLLFSSSIAFAQPPGGGGQRPAPDPRSMGGGNCANNPYNCKDTPNPLPPNPSVFIDELTWMDVRDALAAGKTTAIITTGGVEPNGPWLVTGKHNYVNRVNCEAIARKLGNALCAPNVPFVPEGNIDPPSGHMTSPGTISVSNETFQALLTDIAHSLKMHGFKNIMFIGDSGGNQGPQRTVAEALNTKFGDDAVVAHVQEYYTYGVVSEHMAKHGLKEGQSDGLHDDPVITLNMLMADPKSIRYDERIKAGKAVINGVDISDRTKAMAWGQQIVDFRAEYTAEAIKKAIANKGTLPAPPRTRPQGQ
jgi:creatinine amidohydrolase